MASNELPFLTFTGSIIYITNSEQCEEAVNKIMSTSVEFVVGFDLEWPVDYKLIGQQCPTAVLQLYPGSNEVFVFHLTALNGLPGCLKRLIVAPRVKKVGLNINGDMKKLGRDFGLPDEYIIANSVQDLGKFANSVLNSATQWSLDGLVKNVLKKSLDKSPTLQCSDWSRVPLNEDQLRYATLDAYASYAVFEALKQKLLRHK